MNDAFDITPDLADELDLPDGVAAPDLTGSYADVVQRLLGVVRAQLGMQVAWVSEFVGAEQVLRYIDADEGANAPAPGSRLPLSGSFCARVLDGRFPALIPNALAVPDAALLDVTRELHIGAYIGVPLVGPHGAVSGMLCAINDQACPGLDERDVAALRLLASLLHDLQQRAVSASDASEERDRTRAALVSVVEGRGRHPVMQPIIALSTGSVVAVEGLTRFTVRSPVDGSEGFERGAAQWFDDADRLGLRLDLELAAAASVLDLLDTGAVPDSVSVTVNLGPVAIQSPWFAGLLAGRDLKRVIVEMTEHFPVTDYERLASRLQPYRDQGLRVAVDDAGAGYASLRHVLWVKPDMVKIDMALTRGVDSDLARRTLLTAVASFAGAAGCQLVAEGVETEGELQALASCGVDMVQGYYLARPSREPAWSGYPAV